MLMMFSGCGNSDMPMTENGFVVIAILSILVLGWTWGIYKYFLLGLWGMLEKKLYGKVIRGGDKPDLFLTLCFIFTSFVLYFLWYLIKA